MAKLSSASAAFIPVPISCSVVECDHVIATAALVGHWLGWYLSVAVWDRGFAAAAYVTVGARNCDASTLGVRAAAPCVGGRSWSSYSLFRGLDAARCSYSISEGCVFSFWRWRWPPTHQRHLGGVCSDPRCGQSGGSCNAIFFVWARWFSTSTKMLQRSVKVNTVCDLRQHARVNRSLIGGKDGCSSGRQGREEWKWPLSESPIPFFFLWLW
jgi:hypothetical protein